NLKPVVSNKQLGRDHIIVQLQSWREAGSRRPGARPFCGTRWRHRTLGCPRIYEKALGRLRKRRVSAEKKEANEERSQQRGSWLFSSTDCITLGGSLPTRARLYD